MDARINRRKQNNSNSKDSCSTGSKSITRSNGEKREKAISLGEMRSSASDCGVPILFLAMLAWLSIRHRPFDFVKLVTT